MPKILKNFMNPQAEIYEFPGADELVVASEPEPEEIEETQAHVEARTPVDYAKLQAAAILQDANSQVEELLERTRAEAETELAGLRETARSEGYQSGYAEGMAAAMMAGKTERERQTVEGAQRIQQFLEKAAQAEDELLDSTRDELRDLAIAVAEKVVRVSLSASGDIISRMILSATEKRKKREWVHIYIAGCDAKTMAQASPTLTAALTSLSEHVRIIPIANDEPGTCLIEMPDEIIDASVSTQFDNIRSLLSDTAGRDLQENGGFCFNTLH